MSLFKRTGSTRSEVSKSDFIIGLDGDSRKGMTFYEMQHMLITGNAGQGKTQFAKSIIRDITNKHYSTEVQFVICDPRGDSYSKVVFDDYKWRDTASEFTDIMERINAVHDEMHRRFDLFKDEDGNYVFSRQDDIFAKMPKIILVLDEYELTRESTEGSNEIIEALVRKGRQVGIHVILITQRVNSFVLNSSIINNMATKVVFETSEVNKIMLMLEELQNEPLRAHEFILQDVDRREMKLKSIPA